MKLAEVHELPLREKFRLLETLWEDLSPKIEDAPLSDSVKSLLDQRLERLASGLVEVYDWNEVKDSIVKK